MVLQNLTTQAKDGIIGTPMTSETKYQVLVHEHRYGVSTYLFPPKPPLNTENAIEFLGPKFEEGWENIYICFVNELSQLNPCKQL